MLTNMVLLEVLALMLVSICTWAALCGLANIIRLTITKLHWNISSAVLVGVSGAIAIAIPVVAIMDAIIQMNIS